VRLFDLVVAAAVLVVIAPLMACIAMAILVEDGRPIFFSQVRLSRRGRHFRIYKFRKFYKRGRPAGHALTLKDDPRLTRVGSLLARTKLDELPQLWNVLKGDMSIVGPRPESLNFADCFEGPYRAVLDHKPGIFGPAQAMSRNEGALHRGNDPEVFYRAVLFPTKARIDLAYYPTRTVMRDIGWIVACALAVLGWSRLPEMGKRIVEQQEHCWTKERPGSPEHPEEECVDRSS
jgi:lipopolysaccharide/colanic/teichoic acid biosynthesis glycosyltransferase